MCKYIGLGFPEHHWIIQKILQDFGLKKTIMGSFPSVVERFGLIFFKADFFITGENRSPEFYRAKKQIGFWRSYTDRNDVFRLPNWMWHLDWPDVQDQPPYPRYGMRLSIDRLMRPINWTYSKRQLEARIEKAVLFSKHLREPRKRLFELTNESIGCDGFGGAFGNDNRQQPKMPLMERYRFSLCPENSIGDGYITEKIPEAFHSGCIPICWCRPEDLAEDFNPHAVVNLYGLDDQQCVEVLTELKREGEYFQAIIHQPLLLNRPSLAPLVEFLHGY